MSDEPSLEECVQAVIDKLDADIYLLSGDLFKPIDDTLLDLLRPQRKKNAVLLLCTSGGHAEVAYRISRSLQRTYEKFYVFVGGWCKSAGTLLLLGAHEVVLGFNAELGPLDVQVLKDDEFERRSSGLAPAVSVEALSHYLRTTFYTQFVELKLGMGLSTKTAAETAATLAVGALAPIYGQLDPLRIAEMSMLTQVAQHYGDRLAVKSENIRPGALDRLVGGYPAHNFVIDLEEAQELFFNVRAFDKEEEDLVNALKQDMRIPKGGTGRVERLAGNPQLELDFPHKPSERAHDTVPAEPSTSAEAASKGPVDVVVDSAGDGAREGADRPLDERPPEKRRKRPEPE